MTLTRFRMKHLQCIAINMFHCCCLSDINPFFYKKTLLLYCSSIDVILATDVRKVVKLDRSYEKPAFTITILSL